GPGLRHIGKVDGRGPAAAERQLPSEEAYGASHAPRLSVVLGVCQGRLCSRAVVRSLSRSFRIVGQLEHPARPLSTILLNPDPFLTSQPSGRAHSAPARPWGTHLGSATREMGANQGSPSVCHDSPSLDSSESDLSQGPLFLADTPG